MKTQPPGKYFLSLTEIPEVLLRKINRGSQPVTLIRPLLLATARAREDQRATVS